MLAQRHLLHVLAQREQAARHAVRVRVRDDGALVLAAQVELDAMLWRHRLAHQHRAGDELPEQQRGGEVRGALDGEDAAHQLRGAQGDDSERAVVGDGAQRGS